MLAFKNSARSQRTERTLLSTGRPRLLTSSKPEPSNRSRCCRDARVFRSSVIVARVSHQSDFVMSRRHCRSRSFWLSVTSLQAHEPGSKPGPGLSRLQPPNRKHTLEMPQRMLIWRPKSCVHRWCSCSHTCQRWQSSSKEISGRACRVQAGPSFVLLWCIHTHVFVSKAMQHAGWDWVGLDTKAVVGWKQRTQGTKNETKLGPQA